MEKMWRKLAVFSILSLSGLSVFGCQQTPDTNVDVPAVISRYEDITTAKVTQTEDIHPPIVHNDAWEPPIPIAGAVNSAGLEDSPFITSDGTTLFFFYTPSAERAAQEQVKDGVTGIYRADWKNGEWGEPERVVLSAAGEVALDGCPFYQNGRLWFCSIRAGNHRDIDMWQAEWDGEKWTDIRNAGKTLNAIYQIGEMHMDAQGETLYFHRPRTGGDGDYNIYLTTLNNSGWQDPIPIATVNTDLDDSRPALSPDGQELWFTRSYLGTPAIFRSKWTGSVWGEPELIISQFAGEPSIDTQGNIYFTHHFYSDGKMVEADIYMARKK
jgi:hypothetical protein